MSSIENSFEDVAPAITEDDLNDVETTCHFVFPPEFRSHYLKYNGGSPERYHYRGDGVECMVQSFLPIRHDTFGYSFEDTFDNLSRPYIVEGEKISDPVLPSYLVAFAKDPGGDCFCFSTRTNDYGAIYYYVGEYSITDPSRAVRLLAGSLSEFLDKLEAD